LSSTRTEWDHLWSIYLPVAIAVAAVVWAAIAFAIVRYRRRAGRGPGGTSERTKLELAVAALLAGVTAVLVAFTFSTEARTDSDPPGAVTVRVLAFQWGWRFTYPAAGVTIAGNSNHPPTFAVPAGETVHFELSSRDVVHAFWVPSQRFKRWAYPGEASGFDLTFDAPGLNGGRCAEFCGLRHTDMTFNVLALPPGKFRSWLAARRAP
jgi:cytochrome c oxidase subunit II